MGIFLLKSFGAILNWNLICQITLQGIFLCLIDIWMPIVKAFENILLVRKHKPKTSSKIGGFL